MKYAGKNTRRVRLMATLGVALAIGGAGYAAAETTSSTTYGVIGKSFVKATGPINVPRVDPGQALPTYSQVNFTMTSDRVLSGGAMVTTQAGQMHAEGSVLLEKPGGGGAAIVRCDLRMTGQDLSHEYEVRIPDTGSATSRATLTLVGSYYSAQAGTTSAGIRCWSPGRDDITIQKADLHAVIYANAGTTTP